jgi:SPP1 family predicted phage head-tail adaptor
VRKWIDPAKYRHQVTIRDQRPAARDSFGERVGPGLTVATVWAEKSDWGGSEISETGRETASVLTKFVIRYRTDILPDMEVVLGSDVYMIGGVLDYDGLKRELVLNCTRVVS